MRGLGQFIIQNQIVQLGAKNYQGLSLYSTARALLYISNVPTLFPVTLISYLVEILEHRTRINFCLNSVKTVSIQLKSFSLIGTQILFSSQKRFS